MKTKQSWSDIEFSKGRYLPRPYATETEKVDFKPYKEETSKLVWNVFNERNGKIFPINLFEYNYRFVEDLLKIKAKYKDSYAEFANEVRQRLQYYYWSKSEYETVITSWPPYIESEELHRINSEKEKRIQENSNFYRTSVNLTVEYKIDIYTQVMLNWDRFIEYLWTNKHLITPKKLGLK
jgi:hypothetical protein